jgi:Fic family protein
VRFRPVPAYLTAFALESLCEHFDNALKKGEHDPLLLIPIYILDFLCIHPFHDGNGRMSRLLTLLLLYRSGYIVGKYISIEKLIEDSKDTYYEALHSSSVNWHENENDYAPFINYQLGILQKAYHEFEERIAYLSQKNLSKTDRIRIVIDRKLGIITKKEIMDICPDISKVTVERTLTALVRGGYLAKVGGGRSTAYKKIQDES